MPTARTSLWPARWRRSRRPRTVLSFIPIKPRHVSTELLQIFKQASGGGGVVEQLPPFTTVTLVKSEPGWVLIARDGKLLGYAAEAKLHKLN